MFLGGTAGTPFGVEMQVLSSDLSHKARTPMTEGTLPNCLLRRRGCHWRLPARRTLPQPQHCLKRRVLPPPLAPWILASRDPGDNIHTCSACSRSRPWEVNIQGQRHRLLRQGHQ